MRGDTDDFEYVLATESFTFEENQRVERFQFWARAIAENAVFRNIWPVLRELARISQSQTLMDLDDWTSKATGPVAERLLSARDRADVPDAIRFLYSEVEAKEFLRNWWNSSMRPRIPADILPLADETFRYDLLTQPVVDGRSNDPSHMPLPTVNMRGETYYVSRGHQIHVRHTRRRCRPSLQPAPRDQEELPYH